MQDYRKLLVWQKAHKLAVNTYALSEYFRRPESWKLRDQIFDAVVSIPANIAEGYARDHLGESLHHLAIAAGSLAELQTLLTLSGRLGYIAAEQLVCPLSLALETERMLCALRRTLRARRNRRPSWHTSRHGRERTS